MLVTKSQSFEVVIDEPDSDVRGKKYKLLKSLDEQVFLAKNDIASYLRFEFDCIRKEFTGEKISDLIKYYINTVANFKGDEQNFYKLSIDPLIKETTDSLYKQITNKYDLIPTNSCTSLIQQVKKVFRGNLFDCLIGKRTYESYKMGQQCPLKFKRFRCENTKSVKEYKIEFNIGKESKENMSVITFSFVFKKKEFYRPSNMRKHILEFLELKQLDGGTDHDLLNNISNTWAIQKKQNKLYLTCTYEQKLENVLLNKNAVAAIDSGITNPITLVIKSDRGKIIKIIGSAKEFSIISKRIKKQKERLQGTKCKSGHGKTRATELFVKSDIKEKNFAKTKAEKMVADTFEYLLKYNVSVLKMENLANFKFVKDDDPRKKIHFRFWRYSIVQQLLIRKCESVGIKCIFVDPRYTSQKCSKCGHIDKKNRNGEEFKCLGCGHQQHADVNAAFNIIESTQIIDEKSSLKKEKKATNLV